MVAWQSLLAAANGAVVVGSFGCEREREREERRRGKERREEERVARQFKHLSRANRIGMTQSTSTHASYGIWSISHTTLVGVTESRQKDWRDSVRCGAMSCHVGTKR
jgi:hypothetical protein